MFRARQEAANLWLAYGPPSETPATKPLPLPDPSAVTSMLRGTAYEARLLAIAEGILRREFALLGYSIQTEPGIRWRRDYVHARESGLAYFRRIPYLNTLAVGDHKVVWELNRHQHLVVLAQAYCLSARPVFLDELWLQLKSWLQQNPFCQGMNWTSALEVAFRAISWLWIEHLVGRHMPAALREPWLRMLFQHGRYLEYNLSVYFSPNTHLQGEALALHALGVFFHGDSAERWRSLGAATMAQCMDSHVRSDGSHREQSSYYHAYSTDMFLFHALLEPAPEAYRNKLRKMAEYLWALSSPGDLPLLGDDDGGRLFHPFGLRRTFARGTLAACAAFLGNTPWHGDEADLPEVAAWWLGPNRVPENGAAHPSSSLFVDAGVAVFSENRVHAVVDTRAFGAGSAGHSHAHALHFTLRFGDIDVLADAGTFTYVADPALRNRFRGTAMHNTVRIDGLDQAEPGGPFRWNQLPLSRIHNFCANPWTLDASCRYRGVDHRRRMAWGGNVLFVLDSFEGGGTHRLEQFWHPAGAVRRIQPKVLELPAGVCLVTGDAAVSLEEGGEFGWISDVPGSKISAPVICCTRKTTFPAALAVAFVFPPHKLAAGGLQTETLHLETTSGTLRLSCAGQSAEFGREKHID
ncbi:MAG: alginate lyase family protein [Bryobacteraceae bacterium]